MCACRSEIGTGRGSGGNGTGDGARMQSALHVAGVVANVNVSGV